MACFKRPEWWLPRHLRLPNNNENVSNRGEHVRLAMDASVGEDNVGFANEVVLISKVAGAKKGIFLIVDCGATRHVTN